MNSGVQTASHADRVQIITWTHSFFTLCGYARHYWDNIVTVNKRISCQEMDYNDANVTRHISLMTAIWNSSVLNYIVWSQFLSLQYCSLVQKVMNISPHSFLVSPAPEDKELHFVAHLRTLKVCKMVSLPSFQWQFHGLLIIFWVNFTTMMLHIF